MKRQSRDRLIEEFSKVWVRRTVVAINGPPPQGQASDTLRDYLRIANIAKVDPESKVISPRYSSWIRHAGAVHHCSKSQSPPHTQQYYALKTD